MHRRRISAIPTVAALYAVALAGAALLAACGGGSSNGNGTTTAPTSRTMASPGSGGVATQTAAAGTAATAAAGSAAGKLVPALLQSADVPSSIILRPEKTQVLQPGDVIGLTTAGSGVQQLGVSQDQKNFLTMIIVVPDSGGPQSMLAAFTLDQYVPSLTGKAADAAGADVAVPGSPAGTRAFTYSGTATSPAGVAMPLHGETLAFIQGNRFVVLNYGTYVVGAPVIDLGTIAGTVARRLAALPGAG